MGATSALCRASTSAERKGLCALAGNQGVTFSQSAQLKQTHQQTLQRATGPRPCPGPTVVQPPLCVRVAQLRHDADGVQPRILCQRVGNDLQRLGKGAHAVRLHSLQECSEGCVGAVRRLMQVAVARRATLCGAAAMACITTGTAHCGRLVGSTAHGSRQYRQGSPATHH